MSSPRSSPRRRCTARRTSTRLHPTGHRMAEPSARRSGAVTSRRQQATWRLPASTPRHSPVSGSTQLVPSVYDWYLGKVEEPVATTHPATSSERRRCKLHNTALAAP
eukprot:scaffold813_cov313-Prasinococcus_capsulatus_cf.AAC.5